jgi:hypothetical protein
MKLVANKFKSGGLHEKHVVATWNLGNLLSISLNSSAIRAHISEVGAVLYILVSEPSKWLFWSHIQYPVLYSFQLEKSIPKTQVIPHWQDTWNGLSFSHYQKCKDKWHNLRSNYIREGRKSKEKISESGTTVRGKWPYYDVTNFLEYCLQRRSVEMIQRQQLQLKLHSLIQMKLKLATVNNWKEKI